VLSVTIDVVGNRDVVIVVRRRRPRALKFVGTQRFPSRSTLWSSKGSRRHKLRAGVCQLRWSIGNCSEYLDPRRIHGLFTDVDTDADADVLPPEAQEAIPELFCKVFATRPLVLFQAVWKTAKS